MYINKSSVANTEAADKINLLHSTSCRFEQYESCKPGQMLGPCLDIRHFMIVTKKLSLSDIKIKH